MFPAARRACNGYDYHPGCPPACCTFGTRPCHARWLSSHRCNAWAALGRFLAKIAVFAKRAKTRSGVVRAPSRPYDCRSGGPVHVPRWRWDVSNARRQSLCPGETPGLENCERTLGRKKAKNHAKSGSRTARRVDDWLQSGPPDRHRARWDGRRVGG